jgi:ABC-2 type transport system permease protein
MGVGYALVTGDGGAVWRLTWQTLTWLPAVLVLSGLTRLLHGLRPRLGTLGWLGLGYVVVVLVLAEVLRFPDWLRDLSPFEHLALVPAVDVDPVAFAAVLGVATLLGLGGWFAFTRRDIG